MLASRSVKFLGAWLILCLACSLIASDRTTAAKAAQPEVILVTIDTLRADHIRCYGYDRIKTPALDGIARDGIRFSQAFTPSPITNSSHASILTGLLPSHHGVTDFAVPLSPAHFTLAELMKGKGYHSAAFIGAVILDSKSLAPGFERGFDFYDNFPEHPASKSRWGRLERRGIEVVQHAEHWLDTHPAGSHFLWLHLYDPHDPYEPPEPYSRIYSDRLYDGEIAYADSALAGFMTYLKRRGRYEGSLIVVVGDHGEGLGEHQEDTHGIFLYDSTTHIPLILKLPKGLHYGRVVDAQVRTIDILPTVLDLAGVPIPSGLDGNSLQPLFTSTEAAERIAFGETDYPLRFGWAPLRSARTGAFKFIEAPRPEYFDLRADPGELKNQYEPWNPGVESARAALTELRAKFPPVTSSQSSVGPGTIDELKALGYLTRADSASSTAVPEVSRLPDPKDKIQQQNLLHAAMIALEDSRTAEARRSLEKALQLDPHFLNALEQLGELELRLDDFSNAALHLRQAFEQSPDNASIAFNEGVALERIHDLPSARDALEESLKLKPAQPQARVLLGNVYLGLKELKAAEDQFAAVLLIQPSSLEAQIGLAKVQLARGNPDQAVRGLEPLTKSHSQSPEVCELLSRAYSDLGKTTKALSAGYCEKSLRRRKSQRAE